MKFKILLIVIFLFSINNCFASIKIIAETSLPQTEFIVIRGETGKREAIKSWRKDNKSFLIDCNDLHKDSIFLQGDFTVRLYEVSNQKATKWIDLMKLDKISLAECFVKYFDRNIDMPEFIVPSYISETISKPEKRLRNDEKGNGIFTQQLYEFTSINKISFPCTDKVDIKKVLVYQLINDEIIYSTENQLQEVAFETKLQQLNFEDEQLQLIKIEYFNNENVVKQDSALFKITPIVFTNQSFLFTSKDLIIIAWQTALPEISIEIKDSKGKMVWKAKTFAESFFSAYVNKTKIRQNEVYTFTIKGLYNNKLIEKSVSFGYFFSKEENKLLSGFLSKQ